MRKLFTAGILALLLCNHQLKAQSPLATYSAVWNEPRFASCNTAARTSWLSPAERRMIYILNLARQHPQLFLQTVVKAYPDKAPSPGLAGNSYYRSLVAMLEKQAPQPLLRPDSLAWVSARCHAQSSGKAGHVGHDRITTACEKLENFSSECCHYGYSEPLDIVLSLMMDRDVPGLGHRKILYSGVTRVGLSLQPHTSYGFVTVLDFH